MRVLGQPILLVFSLVLLSAPVWADIPVGFVSWDVNFPGNAGQFDITNETASNASTFPDMTFPIVTGVTLSSLTLTVDFSDGSTTVFGSSYFTPSGLSFDGSPIGIGGTSLQPIDAILTGDFSPLTVALNDGSTANINAGFTAKILPSAGLNLNDGDFAVIAASPAGGPPPVPEPSTWVLFSTASGGLLLFRCHGTRNKTKATDKFATKPNRVLNTAFWVCCVMLLPLTSWAVTSVKLNANTMPSTGVAGVNNVNATGSGFLAGIITPSNIVVSWEGTCGGPVVTSTFADSITTILGSTKRVNVAIPGGLATGTWFIQISDSAVGDANFNSSDCSAVNVTHTNTLLNACVPSSSLGILAPPTAGAVSAYVPNLYVSPTGSDLNSGTVTAPWQTVQHAFDNVHPGQTVCFRTGTYPMTVSSGYNQRLNNSGTSSSPITFTNYPGEVAIIHGNTLVAGAYVTFVGTPAIAPGLIFEGPTGQPLDVIDVLNTHDVTFDHVEIRNGDYHAGLYQSGGYNIKLIGCYVHDNGRPGSINSDQGIYWDATTGGGNLIANCVVEHNVSAGIQLYPSPSQVTVEENTIVNNGNYGAVVYGDQNAIVNNIFSGNGVIANNPQMEVDSGTNHVIDSNIFWSSTASLQGYINLTNVPVTHSLNTNPLFVDPANHNYHLQAGSPAIKAGNGSYAQLEDKDGIQRDSPSDLGAYGYTPPFAILLENGVR